MTTTTQMTARVQKRRQKDEDAAYAELLAHVEGAIGAETGPLFTTDAANLFDVFLAGLPADRRQHYTCNHCRHFFERFGGLATIDDSGHVTSPIWDGWHPAFFGASALALASAVVKAKVTGVFLSSEKMWGVPSNVSPKSPGGEWHHLHIVPHPSIVHCPGPLANSDQVMAAKREEHGMACRGLADFAIETVRLAHTLLTTDALYRSEKCIGVAKWLLELHEARATTKHGATRDNLVWRAVATAPAGFCHVRTTMIATLLEDIDAGKPFADIKRAFDAKMNPTQYQRPQAAPTDGQLAAAETVIAKLASAGSLARRCATLDDVRPHALWTPKPKKSGTPDGGVFGHLKSTKKAPMSIDVPSQIITWEKFQRTVLPDAEAIECCVPGGHANFFAFVTAENLEAPPILQWDSEARRNPVSMYVYRAGTPASQWGLVAGEYVDVAAITAQPARWTSDLIHHGDGAYFVLNGARDSHAERAGLALFPEILKSDYHGIRASIEAYSQSRHLSGREQSSACGIACQKSTAGSNWNVVVRVTSKGARVTYRLDRWD